MFTHTYFLFMMITWCCHSAKSLGYLRKLICSFIVELNSTASTREENRKQLHRSIMPLKRIDLVLLSKQYKGQQLYLVIQNKIHSNDNKNKNMHRRSKSARCRDPGLTYMYVASSYWYVFVFCVEICKDVFVGAIEKTLNNTLSLKYFLIVAKTLKF